MRTPEPQHLTQFLESVETGVQTPEPSALEQFLESVESLHRVQTKSEPLNHRECSLLTTYWSESTVSS